MHALRTSDLCIKHGRKTPTGRVNRCPLRPESGGKSNFTKFPSVKERKEIKRPVRVNPNKPERRLLFIIVKEVILLKCVLVSVIFRVEQFDSDCKFFFHILYFLPLHRSLVIQQMFGDLQTPLWLSGRADWNCNNESAFQMNTLTFHSSLCSDC